MPTKDQWKARAKRAEQQLDRIEGLLNEVRVPYRIEVPASEVPNVPYEGPERRVYIVLKSFIERGEINEALKQRNAELRQAVGIIKQMDAEGQAISKIVARLGELGTVDNIQPGPRQR